MDKAQNIRAVAQELKSLFADKAELSGFHDWDVFIGCIMLLEKTAGEMEAERINKEVEENGEL